MTRLREDLESRLRDAAPGGISWSATTDAHGVTDAWIELGDKGDLAAVAAVLRSLGARLSMITGSRPPAPPEAEEDGAETETEDDDGADAAPPKPATTFGGTPLDGTSYELTHHFDLAGDTVTVVAFVGAGDSIASLTPLYRAADWPEREIMETYALTVAGHPDPRRLFIDASIEPSVLERLIPFSTLVNAASTKDLWDRIVAKAKAGAG